MAVTRELRAMKKQWVDVPEMPLSAMAHGLHQTAGVCVFVCDCITTSPFTSLLKSIIYGNGTSTLLWALCRGPQTHTHKHKTQTQTQTLSHTQTHTACHQRAGRLNRWHRLYPLHRLLNTHTHVRARIHIHTLTHSAVTGFVSSPHLTEWCFYEAWQH